MYVLICDSDRGTAEKLRPKLAESRLVDDVTEAESIMAAKKSLEANHIDIIVLDFFGLGIYESGDFIDAVRRKWPEVVIVMHADAEMFELNASYFDGARSRLPHYYRLSRDLDGEALAAQADEVLGHCLMDLGRSVAPENACDAAGSGGQA